MPKQIIGHDAQVLIMHYRDLFGFLAILYQKVSNIFLSFLKLFMHSNCIFAEL